MKKYLTICITLAAVAALCGCGDNKTTSKLVGTSVYSGSSFTGGTTGGTTGSLATTPKGSSASMVANSASMVTLASKGGAAFLAPHINSMIEQANNARKVTTGLTGPDADGYFTNPAITGSTFKIRFQDVNGNAITDITGSAMAGLATVRVKLTSVYSFGTFNGDFTMIVTGLNATEETMQSGTISLSNDPAGLGGFTASIDNMIIEISGTGVAKTGTPKSGTMSIVSANGAYSGTNTFTTSGGSHKCDGDIFQLGAKVAEVHLTYNSTLGNYDGYWLDSTANDGVQHQITANVK